MTWTIQQGDVLTVLQTIPDASVHCVVTSPPYWGLRDYGVAGQFGLEKTPEEYVARMVEVFREIRRVLRDDGTLWLNLGDSYATQPAGNKVFKHGDIFDGRDMSGHQAGSTIDKVRASGLKPKDLVGIPWRVALALQRDGWYLRSDIIWHKRSFMPESVVDRPSKAHEYLFLLAKSERYYYDSDAIKEPAVFSTEERKERASMDQKSAPTSERNGIRPSVKRGGFAGKTATLEGREAFRAITEMRNKRTVWTLSPQPFPDAHFATFPEKLVEPCIKAGTSERGVCGKCGAPWKRKGSGRQETLGWHPTCACGIYSCSKCPVVLESLLTRRSSTNGERMEEEPGRKEALSLVQPVICDSGMEGSSEPQDILHQSVSCKMARKESEDDERVRYQSQGLQDALPTRTSDVKSGRICDGASIGDVSGIEPIAHQRRSGSSQKWSKAGQPTKQSRSDAQAPAQQTYEYRSYGDRPLPKLSASFPSQRPCPSCKTPLAFRPFLPQPALVLDIFAGSGTTGVVALKLGRSFLGIELNPSYVEMAKRRIGDVMPLFEPLTEYAAHPIHQA